MAIFAANWGVKLTGEPEAEERIELAPPPGSHSIAALAAEHSVVPGGDTLEASKAILAKLAQR